MIVLFFTRAGQAAAPGRVSVELADISRATGQGWAIVRILDARGRPLPAGGKSLQLRGAEGTRVGQLHLGDDGLAQRAWVEPAIAGDKRVTCVEALWDGELAGGLRVEEPLTGPAPLPPIAAAAPALALATPPPLERPPPIAAPPRPPPQSATQVETWAPPPPPSYPPLHDVIGRPTALVATAPPASPWLPPETAVRLRTVIDLSSAARAPGALLTLDAEGGSERAAGGISASAGRPLRAGAPVNAQAALFGRLRLLATPVFALALALDASLPGSGPESLSLSPVRSRIALAAGLRLGPATLSTAQALAAGSPSSALRPSGWDSSTWLSLRLLPQLDAAAQLDTLLSTTADAGYRHAFAAGAGAALRLGAFQLGAGLRAGLGKDGALLFGNSSLVIGLSLAARE